MSTRLHLVVPDELVARIDAAKHEGQPRADWIRRVIEQVLNRADGRAANRAVEQLPRAGVELRAEREFSAAKRDVQPIPKGKA